jgi:hypothetical protein
MGMRELGGGVVSPPWGTPTNRQVSKRSVLKRPVSKRPVSKRLKRQVYKMSGLQNVRFTKCQVLKTSGPIIYFRFFLPYITIIASNT